MSDSMESVSARLGAPAEAIFCLLNSPNRPFLVVLSYPRVAVLASRRHMWDCESCNGQKTLRMILVSSLVPLSIFIYYFLFI